MDVFRINAALVVFLFHSNIGEGIKCQYGILNGFISMGAIFMTGFFMLSGYSLFYRYHRIDLNDTESKGRFYKKRFIGIMPLYYVVGLLYIMILGAETLGENLLLAPIEIMGLQSVFSTIWDRTHNGGTWFVSCMVISYFLYPFIQETVKRISIRTKLFMVSFSIFVLLWSPFVVHYFNTFFIYHNPFFRFLEFGVGVLLGSMLPDIKKCRKLGCLFLWRTVLLEFLILVIGVSLGIRLDIARGNYMLYSWIALPAFAALLLSLSGAKGNRFVSSKPVRYLSSISYAFFLAQFFTWEIVRYLFPKYGIVSNVIRILICLIIAMVIASLLHGIIEKPLTKLLNTKLLHR